MKIRKNIPVYSICWLNHAKSGTIGTFYEPESRKELEELCRTLFQKGKQFDIIGHTSNTYFLPSYNCDVMVSTRKVRSSNIGKDCIIADCGVSVTKLARDMVKLGVEGFEGLIDLPGTVGAAIYGNASCYGCSINQLLVAFDMLCPDGSLVKMSPVDLHLSPRSSALKRGEMRGVILSAELRKKQGDSKLLQQLATQNHKKRIATQPGPKDNLGSIYYNSGVRSKFSLFPRAIVWAYGILLKIAGYSNQLIKDKKKRTMITILGGRKAIPYIDSWNRYIWKDEQSHQYFWEYHRLHQLMFKHSTFEIEIKGKYPPRKDKRTE